jgi:hypothetical protein
MNSRGLAYACFALAFVLLAVAVINFLAGPGDSAQPTAAFIARAGAFAGSILATVAGAYFLAREEPRRY